MKNKEQDAMPRQRAEDLVVRAYGEEILVLDRRTSTAHCLPAEVARVWNACTGRNTLAEVASDAGVSERIAASAVEQLISLDLLDVPAGIDRRKLLRRGALVGAGLAAAPVIESVVAPPAWAQGSPLIVSLVQTCTGSTGRQFILTMSGPAPVGGYHFTSVEVPGLYGYIPAGSTSNPNAASFNTANATTQFTILVEDQYNNVVTRAVFTCMACPTTTPGPTSSCTLVG